jgi:3',5'-cyclic AMP phosphodiesterase CpdA
MDGRPRRATVLAHITDAHVAPRGRRNAGLKDRSVEILDDLVHQIEGHGPDAVLFGGDNIDNGGDAPDDFDAFRAAADRFPRWMAIVGNHEAESAVGSGRVWTKEDFAERAAGHGLGPSRLCWSEPVGDVRVIGIDTTLVGTSGGHVSERTMAFLARELRIADEEHVVVLGHHLLAAPWAPYRLDSWDSDYLVKNREAVISLLATCPKVRAYLCGHHHASRVQRIAGRGQSRGFYHILTPSPVYYPHGARVLRFLPDHLEIETVRPRLAGVLDEGLQAVLGGRKAQRFGKLGSLRTFSDYVTGRASDNETLLPYEGTPSEPADAAVGFVERRERAVSSVG